MHNERADSLVLLAAVRRAESLDLETGRGTAAKAHVFTVTEVSQAAICPVPSLIGEIGVPGCSECSGRLVWGVRKALLPSSALLCGNGHLVAIQPKSKQLHGASLTMRE